MSSVMRFDEWQDSDGNPVYDGSGGPLATPAILQVVQTVKTTVFTNSTTTYTDVPDFSVTITPSSASNKVLVTAYYVLGNTEAFNNNGGVASRMVRDSTTVFVATDVGSRIAGTYAMLGPIGPQDSFAVTPVFLDTPATTSAVTYKIQIARIQGAVVTFGRSGSDADNAAIGRSAASITVMEVAG